MNHIRPVFLTLAFTVSMLLWASIAVTPATAAPVPVHFGFQGTVDTTISNNGKIGDNLLDGTSPFGSSPFIGKLLLSGTYRFDASTQNTGSSSIGVYSGTISNLTFALRNISDPLVDIYTGSYNSVATPNSIMLLNNFLESPPFTPGLDGYLLTTPFSGNQVNSLNPLTFEIELLNPFGTPFTDNLLPTTPPDLNVFAVKNFHVRFSDGGELNSITGNMTSLTLATPLPPAVILFGAGLVALIGLGAGSWRLKKNSLS